MRYDHVIRALTVKIKESEFFSNGDLDFYKSIQRILMTKSHSSILKSNHNRDIEYLKKTFNNNLDKLKL